MTHPAGSGAHRVQSDGSGRLLLEALHGLLIAQPDPIRIESEFLARAALAQQVPVAVEFNPHLLEALMLVF